MSRECEVERLGVGWSTHPLCDNNVFSATPLWWDMTLEGRRWGDEDFAKAQTNIKGSALHTQPCTQAPYIHTL